MKKTLFLLGLLFVSWLCLAQPINDVLVINYFGAGEQFCYCGAVGEDCYSSDIPGTIIWVMDPESDSSKAVWAIDGEVFFHPSPQENFFVPIVGTDTSVWGTKMVIERLFYNDVLVSYAGLSPRSYLISIEMSAKINGTWSAPAVQYIWFRLQDDRNLFPDDISCHIPMSLSPNLDSIYMEHPEYLHFQWSTGETTPDIEVLEEGTYSVMVFTECDTIYDSITIRYDGVWFSDILEEPFFSQFGSQIRLLKDGEVEVYNALGQELPGTREREFTLNSPGLYILRFRSRNGAIRTAKIVR